MQKMIAGEAASRPEWDTLETFARTQVQEFIRETENSWGIVVESDGVLKCTRRAPA